jgi:hypothetical protein
MSSIDDKSYKELRENLLCLLNLINKLSIKFQVYSEISNLGSLVSYDEPGESAIKDFNEISESDVFIIYHPMNMQTSTLIELGYAVAKEKKIIVIGKTDILPYLALGLSKYSSDIKILPYSELNESIFEQVEMLINEFLNKSDN